MSESSTPSNAPDDEALPPDHELVAGWLHDYPLQLLTAARLRLYAVTAKLADANVDNPLARQLSDQITQVEQLLEQAARQTRAILHGQPPQHLDNQTLSEALELACQQARSLYAIDTTLTLNTQHQPDAQQIALLARCLREGLINAAKHADASEAVATVEQHQQAITLRVTHASAARKPGASESACNNPLNQMPAASGLALIRAAADQLSGQLHLDLDNPDTGRTELTLTLPI